MNKVYIVQEVLKRVGDELRPVHDLSPAAIYGELVPLLGSSRASLSPTPMIQELRRKLRHFSDDDMILPIGDPVAIGVVIALASENNIGRVKVLKWDREARNYIKLQLELR